MFLDAENTERVEINKDEYLNVIVSFWKKDLKIEKVMLCVGALIKLNWVFVTFECSQILHPRNEIGVQTRTMYSNEIDPVLIIDREHKITGQSRFTILVVSSFI